MDDIMDDEENVATQELRRLLARWLTLDGERYHLKSRCDAKLASGKKTPPGSMQALADLDQKIQTLEGKLLFLSGAGREQHT